MPVAAILVASIRLHFLDVVLNAQSRGPVDVSCDASVHEGRRTRLVRARLDHHRAGAGEFRVLPTSVAEGARIRAGEPLLRKPPRLDLDFAARMSLYGRVATGSESRNREERWRGRLFWRREALCCGRQNAAGRGGAPAQARNEWVLPKGKLDDGETPRAAAEREVLEETGHDVSVHEFLGTLVYESRGGSKVVHYWRMEARGERGSRTDA